MTIKKPSSSQPIPSNAKRVFKGKLFDTYQWEQKMFDGSFATFEKIKRPSTVMIIPIVKGKIVLTDQEQPATGRFIGAIGGIVDPGEDVLVAAKRELLEESGYEAKKWILWDSVQLINKIEWPVYTFIARGCRKVKEMSLDAGEKIKLKSFSFEQFLKVAADPEFRDHEIALKVLRAKADPRELKKLRKDLS